MQYQQQNIQMLLKTEDIQKVLLSILAQECLAQLQFFIQQHLMKDFYQVCEVLGQLELYLVAKSLFKKLQILQDKKMNTPFIIKKKPFKTLLPADSEVYDEAQETRIQILQAANGYLAISMLYEAFKLFWSFWHFAQQCPDYAFLSMGFVILNCIWSITSFLGFKSIRSKNSRNIRLFSYTTIANFVLRLLMYIICGLVMKGYVPTYMDFSDQQLTKLVCNAVYPESLMIIEGIIQAIVSLCIMFLTRGVIIYVQKWEQYQTRKHFPQKIDME